MHCSTHHNPWLGPTLSRAGLFLLVFSLSSAAVRAQTTVLDSIRLSITRATNDTSRLAAMIALSEHIYTTDPDTNAIICRSAIKLADKALSKAGGAKLLRSTLLRQKATAINNLAASHYMFGDLDSAQFCFLQARSIHQANGSAVGVADAWNNEALVHEARGDHAEQRSCLAEAMRVYARSGDKERVGYALNNIGQFHTAQGDMDSALFYLDSSLQVFQALKNHRGIASSLLNIGMNHKERGRPAEALERFLECERVYERIDDRPGLAACQNNIAAIYQDQGLPEQAMRYYHKALDLNSALGDPIAQANNHMNLGAVLDEQGELDLALAEFEKGLALFVSTGDKGGEALVRGHMANVWKNKGARDNAFEQMRMSLALSKELGTPHELSTALYKMGHFFEDADRLDSALWYYDASLKLDQASEDREAESFAMYSIATVKLKQGRTKEAERLAERALAIAQESGYPLNIMRATQVLHDALAKQGRWARALEVLELHQQMKDSLNSAENAKKTVRLQMRYDFDREQLADSLAHLAAMAEMENERRIATLEGEQARNRSWAFGIGGLLLLGGGGLVYRIDRRRRKERFERDAARLQTQVLRTQMNPHFIFNALNSINNYVQENERDLASGFLTKFARLMRLVLENSRHNEVPLVQDLEALRLYMELEQARMNGKFDYSIEVDAAIDQAETMVPPLVLQPFVENAIWHGISRKEGKGYIKLIVRKYPDRLTMSVEDDGVGRGSSSTHPPPDGASPKASLGTTITQDRLSLLGKQRGGEAGFRFLDLEQGTRVEVELPI